MFVTGGADFGWATVAYDAGTGAQLWVATVPGPGGYSSASSLAVSPDGTKVFVTGNVLTSQTQSQAVTIAYEATTGTRLWIARYSPTGTDVNGGTAIQSSPDGTTVYVAGYSGGDVTNFATLAYDSATGDQLWVAPEHGKGLNTPVAMALSSDGARLIVTGYGGSQGEGYDTVSYDAATGSRQWTIFDWHGAFPYALGFTPDDATVIITGEGCGGGGDVATFAYDATSGQKEWAACYDAGVFGSDVGQDLAINGDGTTVFVTGESDNKSGDGDWDFITLAYSIPDGHQLWAKRHDRSQDYGKAVDLSPDGRTVYVTGESSIPGLQGIAYVTIAYDASNGQRLASTGIGPGSPMATALSPDGTALYVTGYHYPFPGPTTYGTVAYIVSP